MFKPVSSKVDFPALERNILKFWNETQAFKKLVVKNQGKPRWSFIDGPITANNPMGVHHAWGRTYKDLWQRYKAMQGYDQVWQNGFDCQGLWVEVEVEKELGFNNKRDIEAFGIAPFVVACKQRVLRYSAIQTEQSIRLGMWTDWNNPQELRLLADKLREDPEQNITVNGPNGPVSGSVEQIVGRLGLPELGGSYFTFSDENNYTIWHFLKKCYERRLIYKGKDSVPWCPRCETAISQQEILQEEYRPLTHASVVVKFPAENGGYFLAWTTTPWSIPGTIALMVHPDFDYVKVRQEDGNYILAKGRLSALKRSYEVLEEFKGRKLIGRSFIHPHQEFPALKGQKFPLIPAEEFVTLDIGTGIVTDNPGVGHEDYLAAQKVNLKPLESIDAAANFLPGYGWLSGKNAKDEETIDEILQDLRKRGFVYDIYDYTHRYPVCWRCHTELVFRLVDEWYISMQDLRYEIMEVSKKIRWIPDFGLERELDWLRNMSDWMISKKRYWGLALPIYECRHGHFEVIGSEVELQERAVEGWEKFEGHSPHRPWVDAVKIRLNECGEVAFRIPDVGNPWLDAGIVPFSTLRFRRDRKYWEGWFPADFITESFPGQYRNWFYALLAMSTVLENQPPFLTILGHGTVRDEKGEEMHKSKGNLILFDEAADKAGVDIMRWMYAAQNRENNLNFAYRVADEVRRRFHIPLWNVYSFFVTYARIDGWTPEKAKAQRQKLSDLDRWIQSRLHFVVKEVTASLDDYDAATASRRIEEFVEDLSNWYVRRSRRRFWKSEQDEDKNAAYATLYECLVTLSQILAPFVPFLAEEVYQNLVRSLDPKAPESVHHNDWPQVRGELIDEGLMEDLRLVMKVASLGHGARSKAGIKVRQPLAEAVVVTADGREKEVLEQMAEQLLEELNLKKMVVTGSLGKEHSDKDYSLVEEGGYVVGVKTTLTAELVQEGLAREIVRRVQSLRKQANFNIDDKVLTYYQTEAKLLQVIAQEGDYIRRETLSEKLIEGQPPAGSVVEEYQIEGERLTLGLVRRSG